MKKSSSIRKAAYPLWLVFPTTAIYTLFTVVPLIMSVFLSFTDWNINRLNEPTFNGITNYATVFGDPVLFCIRSMPFGATESWICPSPNRASAFERGERR